MFKPILEDLGLREKLNRSGIRRRGLYALRHMNANLMDTLNTPMKTRQKRLDHAQIETTLKHYTHAMDADDRRTADRIGALLTTRERRARGFHKGSRRHGFLAVATEVGLAKRLVKMESRSMKVFILCLGVLMTLPAGASDAQVAFSPNGGATDLVVRTIESAHHTILMAAYTFTSRPIAAALVKARQRGVDVPFGG